MRIDPAGFCSGQFRGGEVDAMLDDCQLQRLTKTRPA
jgi:hypothetical protein